MLDNQKPLKDWTLGEVKEYCKNRQDCKNCIFKREEIGGCLLRRSIPDMWTLSEKPKYTKEDIEKLKAIKVLYPKAEEITICSFPDFTEVHITAKNFLVRTKIEFCSLERNKTININETLGSE